MKEGRDIAIKFDNKPNYKTTSIKFASGEEHSAHDDMGSTAKTKVMSLFTLFDM